MDGLGGVLYHLTGARIGLVWGLDSWSQCSSLGLFSHQLLLCLGCVVCELRHLPCLWVNRGLSLPTPTFGFQPLLLDCKITAVTAGGMGLICLADPGGTWGCRAMGDGQGALSSPGTGGGAERGRAVREVGLDYIDYLLTARAQEFDFPFVNTLGLVCVKTSWG